MTEECKGRLAVIVRALYDARLSGRQWRSMLADVLFSDWVSPHVELTMTSGSRLLRSQTEQSEAMLDT